MIDAGSWRRLAFAAALSGVVHAAAITMGRLDLPRHPADLPPLAARLVHATAAPVAPPHIRESRPVPRPRMPDILAMAQTPAERAVPPTTEPEAAAAVEAAPPAAAAAEPPAEPVVVATAPSSTLAMETRALPSFPRRGRITYNLVYGRDQFPVGLTVQSWQIDGARYLLASRSETSGIVDLFRSQHRTYSSRGELTPDGLRPDTFLMSRDRGRGAEEARAHFDWKGGSVTLGSSAGGRAQALPRGSQDLLSFMYQLALDPPRQGRITIPVTAGTRLETYVFDVLPEERLDTPLGALRTLPIRQVRTGGGEGIDLWLAVEYRHLPVRIRLYGRDGEPSGEQIVREIRLSEDSN